jgi:hypothetical protein
MSAEEGLRVFSPVVVFIDDGFAPVSLDLIDADDWAALRGSDLSAWGDLQTKYSLSSGTPMDLKRGEGELANAWKLYNEDPKEFAILDPIFKRISNAREIAILPLREIMHIFKIDHKIEICCHPDIESAEQDIRRSKLVFLDFYLYQQSTANKAIEDVGNFSSLLSSKAEVMGGYYNRFLFLISTSLPSGKDIERFRKAAKVKAAFFKPVSKDSLNQSWIEESLAKRVNRYDDLHHLALYLDTFSEQMDRVTDSLRVDLESLELHDLAILDHMRLKIDGEALGNYVSWLISEALAARIRDSAPMLEASKDVSAVQRPPFHGMLSPNQVLFSWFSEITFGSPSPDDGKIQFGDVYCSKSTAVSDPEKDGSIRDKDVSTSVEGRGGICECIRRSAKSVFDAIGGGESRRPQEEPPNLSNAAPEIEPKGSRNDQANDDLILVVAPACDLQRADCSYEVLCVRGHVVRKTPRLVDLMEQPTALGRDNTSGKYKHLLKRSENGEVAFLMVEWHPNRIATIAASDLKVHLRLARMNEIFCQEIKEDALRQVGRVGVPVDPAFNIGLGATIVYSPRKKDTVHIEVPDSDIISGVFTSGNSKNTPRIILAEEFIERFCDEATALKQAAADDPSLEDVCAKFEEARGHFLMNGGDGFEIKKNQASLPGGRVKISYVSEFVRESGEKRFFGVYFYPRGAVKDPPTDDASILDD